MNQQVCKFIDQVIEEIKYKKIRPYVALEIEDHIETLKEDCISKGVEEEEAYKKAISQMGDATLIGQELHKTHKPHIEWSIIMLLTTLIGIGLYTLVRYHNSYDQNPLLHIKHIIYVGMGIITFSIAHFFDYKKLEKWSLIGYILGMLLLVFPIFFGRTINGVTRWIQVGPFSISSFSIASLFLLFGYSGLVFKIKANSFMGIVKLLGLIGLPVFFIFQQPNMSKACLLGIALLSLLIFYICSKEFEGNRTKSLAMLGTMLMSAVTLILLMVYRGQLLRPYQLHRLTLWLNPQNAAGRNYFYTSLRELYEGAKWLGDSKMAFTTDRMPDLLSDLIFTSIVSSYGWIVAIILMSIIAYIILRMFLVTSKVKDLYGRLLSFAIATLFTAQFIGNILMNLGYSPYTASHLPFVSYGGSNIFVDMALMGLLLGIYRRKDILLPRIDKAYNLK